MKRFLSILLALAVFTQVSGQLDSSKTKSSKKDWSKLNLKSRAKDHFMMQFGLNKWTNTPDSINASGFARSFNGYFMMDFPFDTYPRFSVGLGAGLGADNQYFEKTRIDITGSRADRLGFENMVSSDHFKKYKLTTVYLEAPVELRFILNPEKPHSSLKGALGVKVGTLLTSYTKGKNLLDVNGSLVNGYTAKEKSKKYFNNSRLSVMGRVGFGVFSVYASYQINTFIKDGYGPLVHPLQFGIAVSGL
jgi:hypothetical protein